MSTRSLLATAALAAALAAPQARAANGEWTTVASACMPDESSNDKWSMDGAAVQFAAGQTGTVVLRCNVTDPADYLNVANPIWNRMDVTFDDPDGPAIGNRVQVHLRRVHESTGLSSTIATFDSNVFAAGQQLKSASFAHAFDFTNYAYYVQITLTRDGLPAPRAQRVRLYVGGVAG